MEKEEGLLKTSIAVQRDRTEGYLKKIAKNAGISAGGSIIGYIFAPISGIITTRVLGAELYGIYTLATYWTNLLAEISRVGFGGTIIRFIGAYKGEERLDKAKGAILLTLKIGVIIASLLTVGMLLFAEPFCTLLIKRPDAAPAFRFFSLNILFTAIYGTFIAGLTGFQAQRFVVLSTSVFGNITKIVTLILLLIMGLKLYAALASSLLQDIIVVIFSAIFLTRVFPGIREKTMKAVTESKQLWKFSSTLFATSIFNKYTFQLDLLFLGLFRPTTEVGLYAVALKLQPIIYMPHYAISQIFAPIVAELNVRKEYGEMKSIYGTVTKWTASFSIPIFLTIIFFHEPILNIFGKEFRGAASALLILGLGNSLADIFGLSGHVINMIGRPGVNLANSIITTVISITLFLVLIPTYGIAGAAISYAISIVFINFVRVIQVYKMIKIHPFKITLWKIFCATAVSALVIYTVQYYNLFIALYAGWVFKVILLWIVYGIVMWLLKFDSSDMIIINALKKRIFAQRT